MLETILLVAIAAFVVYFGIKLVKKAVSLTFTVVSVVGVILLVGGFFVVQDAVEFREEFTDSKNVFVMADNGTYQSAVILDLNSSDTVEEYPNVTRIPEIISEEDYPEEYYKFFIVEKTALEKIDKEEIDIGIGTVSSEDLVEAIYSENPAEYLAENSDMGIPLGALTAQIEENFGGTEGFRAHLFGAALINVFGTDPMNLLEEIRRENIIIRPETLLFQTVDLIPMGVFKEVNETDAGQD